MALVLNDRVRETTSVVGTGAATLLGYVTGYQAFSVIGDGNTCYYTISDQIGANWEVGIGTYTSSGNTLARTKILSSSNADALVSFTTGTKDVFITYPAETSVSGGGGGTYPTVQPSLNLDFANSRLLDPRITFVRNSTATYYDNKTSALAEQNLLLQSQTFAITWVNSNTTLGSLTTAPDGTTTAYPLTASAINGTLLQTFTATANAYTFSIYIQRVTGTGNIDITVDGTTYATQTTTGTWTRFNITTTPSAGSKTAGIRLAVSGDVVNIWGAQLEQRSSVTAYTPTTTAAITNYIPQLMTAPAGVARFDCDPITRNSLGLLIEESRTNLLTYSSDFSNAGWVKDGTTIDSDTVIAPDGTLVGDKLIESTSTGIHRTYRTISGITAIPYTFSVYAKYSGKQWIALQISGSTYFDLLNGVVGTSTSGSTGAITPVGNGWYRCSTTRTLSAGSISGEVYLGNSNGGASYTGDGYSGIYIWGAQLEAGSFSTSYIPTVASTVTRANDASSMTGTNFSSWYNISQGTIYVEAQHPKPNASTYFPVFEISDGTTSNRLGIYTNATVGEQFYVFISPNNKDIKAGASITTEDFYKQIGSYSIGLMQTSLNGATVVTGSPTALPIATKLTIGLIAPGTYFTGHIRKLSYYPVALSSSNLVALTS